MLLYANDILIASFDKDHVNKLKAVLSSEFEMNDLGDAKKILGMEIIRNKERREFFINLFMIIPIQKPFPQKDYL